jgi:hypothetical protein
VSAMRRVSHLNGSDKFEVDKNIKYYFKARIYAPWLSWLQRPTVMVIRKGSVYGIGRS